MPISMFRILGLCVLCLTFGAIGCRPVDDSEPEDPCEPECGDRECGDDPVCGESCGTCDEGHCNEDGNCVDDPCEPDCDDRECGPDPICGESCGTCEEGRCEEDGRCGEEPCDPECDHRECGPDPICGQSCGECSAGTCLDSGACSTYGESCDLLTQEPCSREEKCALSTSSDPICVANGDRFEGQTCAASDDCARGLMCVYLSEESPARCHRFCDSRDDPEASCGVDSVCAFEVASTGLCSLDCNPYSNDCSGDTYCATAPGSDRLYYFCMLEPEEGFAELGESCDDTFDCGPARICTMLEGEPTCMRLCDEDHNCGGGDCFPLELDGSFLPGGEGVCDECFPDCDGLECGPDPFCGTSCGECGSDDVCDFDGTCCSPECDERECGEEPACGTFCGACPGADDICTPDGECCTPDCSERECGPDPVCGTSCGSCGGVDTCTDDGECLCEPECGARECGSDPRCGTSCGFCSGDDVCTSGTCCTPSCSGRECGPDPVCGTSCGSCGGSEFCESGSCSSCQPLWGSCSDTSQCCTEPGIEIHCDMGRCEQCAPSGYDCSTADCCDGLYCNPAAICNSRDCSELGMACFTASDCCDSAICDSSAGWTCQNCRSSFTECSRDSQCCAGLDCDGGMCQ